MPEPHKVRLVLVDDHVLVRAALRLLLEAQPGITVVGEASSSDEALTIVTREQPDIILLDLLLATESGIDLLPAIAAAAPAAKTIVLTGVADPPTHRAAIEQGARGIVMKDMAGEMLLKAIEKVSAGELWLDRFTMASLIDARRVMNLSDDLDARRIASLTAREREVIPLLAEGLRNKAIADRLGITETTVRHHLTSIFSKLDVPDRMSLLVYAFTHGLARAPRT